MAVVRAVRSQPALLVRVVFVACLACVACRPAGGEEAGAPSASRPGPAHEAVAATPAASASGAIVDGAPEPPAEAVPADTADEQDALARLPRVATAWCGEGLVGLDEETCYALPTTLDPRPKRLLVYLHGVVPPQATSPQKEGFQRTVVRASERAGAVVLVPRGMQGVGPSATRSWWAWPTSRAAHATHLDGIVARWKRAKGELEAALGAPFERTYLAGSSNGAYFVTLLASRDDLASRGFPVDGFGAMSGGAMSGRSAAALEGYAPRPFYVGFGTHDAPSKRDAQPLAAVLGAAGWPVMKREHPLGHGAREVYLDEAFAFWDAHAR